MRQVVLISGRMCSGKSGLGRRLRDEFGYSLIRTGGLLLEEARRRGLATDRAALHALGDALNEETDHRWVLTAVEQQAGRIPEGIPLVVDNVRTAQQLEHFRKNHVRNLIHAHLYAPQAILHERFERKHDQRGSVDLGTYSEADILKNDEDIKFFRKDADVRINTGRTDGRDTLVRVAARLGLYSAPDVKCVDVLVGGQYGSEGKGHIAAYLSRDYDILLRVGGPNAGHTVSSASGVYTYHQLPSGARDSDAKLLLGPGMTLNVEGLLKEIEDCDVGPERLFIDPHVMIIERQDIDTEHDLVKKIASTGQGGGAAAARRILGRRPGLVRLAKDIPEIRPYVGESAPYRGSTLAHLELAYRQGLSILLEGTQGRALSLYHGEYPYVTSRDTNVAGCLAEAGISPSRVRRILMVVRPTPIRVGNPDEAGQSSGRLKHEVSFQDVAKSARLDPGEVLALEKTSTTKRDRRVGWFEWEQFRQACALNAPTDIVLTFADYIDIDNRNARRFEQLTEDTIKFIEELERVAQAPVSLINTRFPREPEDKIDLRTVIDRRNWATARHRE